MTRFEKTFCFFAIFCVIAIATLLITSPSLRQLGPLLSITGIGFIINIVYIFILLRNLMFKQNFSQNNKIKWTALILIFWPASILYFAKHGLRQPIPINKIEKD